jgi:hypothetical protein
MTHGFTYPHGASGEHETPARREHPPAAAEDLGERIGERWAAAAATGGGQVGEVFAVA